MKRIPAFIASTSVLLLAGCASVPNKQLGFDFTQESTPVMLTSVSSSSAAKPLHFESGTSGTTYSSSTTRGNVTTSSTLSVNQDLNVPLNIQLQDALARSPEWLEVSDLSMLTSESQFLIIGSLSIRKYVLSLDAKVPEKE